jgi:hypothetical protein
MKWPGIKIRISSNHIQRRGVAEMAKLCVAANEAEKKASISRKSMAAGWRRRWRRKAMKENQLAAEGENRRKLSAESFGNGVKAEARKCKLWRSNDEKPV